MQVKHQRKAVNNKTDTGTKQQLNYSEHISVKHRSDNESYYNISAEQRNHSAMLAQYITLLYN